MSRKENRFSPRSHSKAAPGNGHRKELEASRFYRDLAEVRNGMLQTAFDLDRWGAIPGNRTAGNDARSQRLMRNLMPVVDEIERALDPRNRNLSRAHRATGAALVNLCDLFARYNLTIATALARPYNSTPHRLASLGCDLVRLWRKSI